MALGKGKVAALVAAGALAVGAGGAAVALEDTGTTTASPNLVVAQAAPPSVQPLSTGSYSATFNWAGVTEAGQTGYYVYQDGAQVADVSSPTYTFTNLDCGTTFTFGVAAHDGSGNASPTSTTSYSTPACTGGGGSGPLPVNTSLPVVSGTTIVGSSVSTSTGAWTSSPAFTYQWQRCNWQGNGCANISGATLSSYVPVSGDAGHRLQALVTATTTFGSVTALPVSESQAVSSSSRRTFFISTSGSDANNGTSVGTPWKHAPGMAAFTGSYVATTGDHFVFRGGDDFPSGDFPITPANSGTATASYYYGVDKTWFTGASWTQPAFDDGGTSQNLYFNTNGLSFIEIDGIHFTGFHWTGTQSQPLGMIYMGGTTNVSVTNSLFDGWSHDSPAGCAGNCDDTFAAWVNGGVNDLIQADQFDQSTGTYDSGGAIYNNGGSGIVFDRNTCFHVENCVELSGGAVVSNNVLHDLGSGDYDSGNHQNGIEVLAATSTIANNLIYNIPLGTFAIDWQSAGINNLYGNVVYNTNAKEPLVADCSFGGCSTGTSTIDNNTLVGYTNGTNGVGCIRIVNRGGGNNVYGTVTEINNHCIGTSLNDIDSGASITNPTQTTNLLQTTAQATSAGYTTSNQFAPTDASSPTVDAGTNLTSSCTGDVLPLCTSFDGHARVVSGAWDQGAYEWLP